MLEGNFLLSAFQFHSHFITKQLVDFMTRWSENNFSV